jgi:hypothetical protein
MFSSNARVIPTKTVRLDHAVRNTIRQSGSPGGGRRALLTATIEQEAFGAVGIG